MKPTTTTELIRRAREVIKEQGEIARERDYLGVMIKEMNRAIVAEYRRNRDVWEGGRGLPGRGNSSRACLF